MSFEIKRVREERGEIVAKWREILEGAEKENRGLNTEEQTASDKAEADLKVYDERLARLERAEEALKAQIPTERPEEKPVEEGPLTATVATALGTTSRSPSRRRGSSDASPASRRSKSTTTVP